MGFCGERGEVLITEWAQIWKWIEREREREWVYRTKAVQSTECVWLCMVSV